MVKVKILSRPAFSKFILICLLGLIALLKLSLLQAAEEIPIAERQSVSFEDIQELPYRVSDYKVYYGVGSLQFGRLWLPMGKNNGTVIFLSLIHI